MTDFIVIGIIGILMALIIRKRVKACKSGESGCGCGCSNCSSARYCSGEHKQ
ncbi:FeoB-associated Cys-rich membrane protein [[Clostridium] polysaccharolyticum]|uniref:FeoB-associated Cys-rich membrane protein n=1 Tax=[Clostridium] polysaccharolyticum TaxID=29364 RepID=UPI00241DB801|nr:FeoB-associated Cys-rich membrane protein [[Clostridium] polysaccharolyticum]